MDIFGKYPQQFCNRLILSSLLLNFKRTTKQLSPILIIKSDLHEIYDFITSMLEQLLVKEQRLIPQWSSELAAGSSGILSCLASGSNMSYTSKTCQSSYKILSCQPLSKVLEKHFYHQGIIEHWWKY